MKTAVPMIWLRATPGVLALVLMATGCREKGGDLGWWEGEQQRIQLSHELELKRFRLEQLGPYSDDRPQLEKVRADIRTQTAVQASLKMRSKALKEEFELMQADLAGFRESALRDHRNRAIGRKFPEFVTSSGRKFSEVIVASIDDAGVGIRHSDGTARLRIEDLDPEQRLFFGLEPELAVAAAQKEARDVAAYERWIDRQMVVVREKEEQSARINAQEQRAEQTKRLLAARQTVAASVSPLAKPATSVGSGYSSYRYYRYRPYYRTVYYTPTYYPTFPRTCYPSTQRSFNSYYTPVVIQNRKFDNSTFPTTP